MDGNKGLRTVPVEDVEGVDDHGGGDRERSPLAQL
jgi:hypothetical protein